MISAIVLLTAEKSEVHSIAETFADMKEITEVYSIAGRRDSNPQPSDRQSVFSKFKILVILL